MQRLAERRSEWKWNVVMGYQYAVIHSKSELLCYIYALRRALTSTRKQCHGRRCKSTLSNSVNANMILWSHRNGVDTAHRATDVCSGQPPASMRKAQTRKTALHGRFEHLVARHKLMFQISTLIAPQSTESSFSFTPLSLVATGLLIGQSDGTTNTDKSSSTRPQFGTGKEHQ